MLFILYYLSMTTDVLENEMSMQSLMRRKMFPFLWKEAILKHCDINWFTDTETFIVFVTAHLFCQYYLFMTENIIPLYKGNLDAYFSFPSFWGGGECCQVSNWDIQGMCVIKQHPPLHIGLSSMLVFLFLTISLPGDLEPCSLVGSSF